MRLEPPAPALRREVRERLGVSISLDEADRAMRAEIAFYRAHHLLGSDHASLAELRRRCAAVLREALPAPVARAPVAVIRAALLGSLRFRAFPDAVGALRGLRALGVRLAVVSNWDVSLHDVLARTGLRPYLQGAIASAELGSGKPGAAIFRHAQTITGIGARETVHVGDSLELDVAGARAAGIEPIHLARAGATRQPGMTTIASLRELPALAA